MMTRHLRVLSAEKELIDDIREYATKICSFKIHDDKNNPTPLNKQMGDREIQSIEIMNRVQVLAEQVSKAPLVGLPEKILWEARRYLADFVGEINVLECLSDKYSEEAMAACFASLSRTYDDDYIPLMDFVRRAASPDAVISAVVIAEDKSKEAEATIAKAEEKSIEWIHWLQEQKKLFQTEKERQLVSLKDAEKKFAELEANTSRLLARVGTHDHALRFANEAEEQAEAAKRWLQGAGVMASLIVALACWTENDVRGVPMQEAWPILTTRGVFFSLMSVFMFLFLRSFAASQHNAIVNKHRQNALSTFDFFSKAASDPETRDAVLKEATQAVFSPVSTGFLKAANDTNPTTHVIEMAKTQIFKNGGE